MPASEFSPLGRALVVKPRRRGYKYRPIITVVNGVGMTEDGEVVNNLPIFATSSEPHVWVLFDVETLAVPIKRAFEHTDWFTWDFTDSRDDEVGEGYMSKARLTTFGGDVPGYRKQARHQVWDVARMFSDPSTAADNLTNTHTDLMAFAIDVRSWCEEHDLPLRATLPGLSAMLLRDPRFWPHARGRVPKATNEAIRKYLPGVHQRRLAPTHRRIPNAVALDQRRAYHRAAQEVPTPDPTTLYARGYYNDPENAPELWADYGDELYNRTMGQPGLVALRVTAAPAKRELRPPAVDRLVGEGVIYLWTNEVKFAEEVGLKVEGIVAAWTSLEADQGLPRYGAWAEGEIDRSPKSRAWWLKPTLHATYGLLGSRPRTLIRASRFGEGEPTVYLVGSEPFPVVQRKPYTGGVAITNVAMLGVLQAEIRRRSLVMANTLTAAGVPVFHIHADGLHVAPVQTPLLSHHWTAEGVTNLIYEDDVSWTTDQRDVLPGRDTRMRVELRRHHARLHRILNGADPDDLRQAA